MLFVLDCVQPNDWEMASIVTAELNLELVKLVDVNNLPWKFQVTLILCPIKF